MISSFACQITDLERKITEQTDLIKVINENVEKLSVTEKAASTKHAIDCVQSKVKENTFRINDLSSKVKQNTEIIQNINNINESGSGENEWNINAQIDPGQGMDPMNSWQRGNNISEQAVPLLNTNCFFTPMDKMAPHSTILSGSGQERDSPPLNIDCSKVGAEMGNLLGELAYFKNRAQELEIEVKKSQNMIVDLMKMRDDAMRKLKDSPQHKDNWFEHKLKLLKQDKRRRGETIGKLLKCIDDMRDTGRLDPAKVTDGKAVLAATLASHGLPIEERIRRTVRAVEFDRVPRFPVTENGLNCDSPQNVNNAADMTLHGENQNNSARLSVSGCWSSASGEFNNSHFLFAKNSFPYAAAAATTTTSEPTLYSGQLHIGSSFNADAPCFTPSYLQTDNNNNDDDDDEDEDNDDGCDVAEGFHGNGGKLQTANSSEDDDEEEVVLTVDNMYPHHPLAEQDIYRVASDIAHEYGFAFNFSDGYQGNPYIDNQQGEM